MAFLCVLANTAQATELPPDLKSIISRGHGAYEVGQEVYFLVEAGKEEDRTKEVFLKIDDKLSHLILNFATRVSDDEKATLKKFVHPTSFEDLLVAIKLDRRGTPAINAKQIWLSEDGWRALYKAERQEIETIRQNFPQVDLDYAHQILVRLYHASSAWKKLTAYYWRNALYEDALRAIARSSAQLQRALAVSYPKFSEDPMINAMRILELGEEAFKRGDLMASTGSLKLHEKAARALQIFATLPALNIKEINGRIAYLRQLETAPEWQEFLTSVMVSAERSMNIEWVSIAGETGSYIPLYTLRTAGTMRISPGTPSPSKHASFQAQSRDPLKRLEGALAFVQSNSNNKMGWVNLGDSMLAIKRQAEALAVYRVALAFEPGDVRLREVMSDLYEKLGLRALSQSMKSSMRRHARLDSLSIFLK